MEETIQAKDPKKGSSRSWTLEEKQQNFLQLLRSGLGVVSPLWMYSTGDWVTSVYAEDIDNDGDIEIIIGSHDGSVRALTTNGNEKWKAQLGQRISTIAVISQSNETKPFAPRVIAGSRNGKVSAIDQNGNVIQGWQYDVGKVVRQIYIDPDMPERVIIGAEDRCVHVLDSTTGSCLGKYETQGRVLCVFSYDVDNDGEREVLAGSSDKHVYILSASGKQLKLKGTCDTEYKVYSVSATRLSGQEGEPVTILTSANGKDLCGWTITEQSEIEGKQVWQKTWPLQKDLGDNLFENRLYAIQALDINRDNQKEILVGSEDKHLYILDRQGRLLWKHYVGHCIHSAYAIDFNYDGIVEVILGLEDNSVQALRVELVPDLYQTILKEYHLIKRREDRSNQMHSPSRANGAISDPGMLSMNRKPKINGSIDTLLQSQPENASALALLNDLLGDHENLRPYGSMELDVARLKKSQREYEDALIILLMLRENRVQHYWSSPRTQLGHIRSIAFGDVQGDPKDEIIVSDEDGEIHALDIERQNEMDALLWHTPLRQRVLAMQMGTTDYNEFDTIYTALADRRVCVLKSDGNILPDSEQPTFKDKTDHVRCIYIDTRGEPKVRKIHEIILGLENNKIYIYDDHLKKRRPTIHTNSGVKVICAHDINGDGEAEIIAGSIDHKVYAYTRDGKELWPPYTTQDHIRAIRAKDVDKDGNIEIIIASEDRNVYVLDWQGQLKWRYYAPHRVLDVDICDLNGDGNYNILVGAADGHMYVLNGQGDLEWWYKTNDRVRAVHARDLNDDKNIEIALASEDRLDLLQMVSIEEVQDLIKKCWQDLTKLYNIDDLKQTIYKYVKPNQSDYLRSFALTRLAGLDDLNTDDFRVFHEALKSTSLTIKKSLVRVVANLCNKGKEKKEVRVQIRQILQQLFTDPNREIRLAIVNMLEHLIEIDEALGFEYLERFKNNADLWVRRTLVRKLHHLCKDHSKQVFDLLCVMTKDEHVWIRQEVGRSLAHFFDLHTSELIKGSHELLAEAIDPAIIAQIASSAKEPIVKQYHSILAQLLQDPNSTKHLDEVLTVLDTAWKQGLACSQETLLLYQELRQLLTVKNVTDIEHYQRITNEELIKKIDRLAHLEETLKGISHIVNIIRRYRRREALVDRVISLIDATFAIDAICRDIDNAVMHSSPTLSYVSQPPEDTIIVTVLQRWHEIIKMELGHVRGEAKLKVELKDRVLHYEEQVVVSLSISNEGRSLAENVHIFLQENEHFEIVGSNERTIEEVTTLRPEPFSFTIKPNTDAAPLISLIIVYNDAERKNKKIRFADRVQVQTLTIDYHFKEISVPYSSGTPIREEKMFYGRRADREFLRDVLTSTDANRVVVLTGQRRSGKTSLIYQLTNNGHWLTPHIPVFIDMQSLALKSGTPQLLIGFAYAIDEALQERDIVLPMPQTQEFENDPTQVFGKYLEAVTQKLMAAGKRLVLLIDEFETLGQKIADKQLDPKFLQYLRSLMQHHQGINFLLAGAPAIRQLTEDYWAVFFNIAQHRRLSRLSLKDAEALITEPVSPFLKYDPLAVERVCYLTGAQPYLIHIMGEAMIRYCNKKHKTYVTINDVNMIVEMVLAEGVNYFGWVWSLATPVERIVLSILSQDKDEDDQGQVRFFSLIDIRSYYDHQGFVFESEKVLASLHHLVQEDILEERLDGTQFRIPVGFIRAWWHINYPIERALREEKLEVP